MNTLKRGKSINERINGRGDRQLTKKNGDQLCERQKVRALHVPLRSSHFDSFSLHILGNSLLRRQCCCWYCCFFFFPLFSPCHTVNFTFDKAVNSLRYIIICCGVAIVQNIKLTNTSKRKMGDFRSFFAGLVESSHFGSSLWRLRSLSWEHQNHYARMNV